MRNKKSRISLKNVGNYFRKYQLNQINRGKVEQRLQKFTR
ncbi:unnamed protein product [Paramecium sonneborni]|uniref:Uncharacterized protein n=1 Tax=Paramecium sonneborni TaxID=65129 RepID=A0A8S1RF93_9CILI|nr:unnamed protein product [Paramecium sonneborni]